MLTQMSVRLRQRARAFLPCRLFHANSGLRSEIVVAVVLLALVVISWLPRRSGPLDLRWDGGVYYVLGTALAQGRGYRLLNEPGEIKATQYPPLLPAMVAAHQKLLGTRDPTIVGRWLRWSFFCLFALYVLSSYAVVRAYLSVLSAFLATLICILHVFTNFLSDLCFAELPFALATNLFVICHRKSTGPHTLPPWSWSLLAALCAAAAYLFRTAGIALLAAWTAESLINKRFAQAAARLSLSLIPIVAWHTYIVSVEADPAYVSPHYAYQRADYMFYNVSYAHNISLRNPFQPEAGPARLRDHAGRFFHNVVRVPIWLGEAVSASRASWFGNVMLPLQSVPLLRDIIPKYGVYVGMALLGVLGCLVLGGVVLQLSRGQLLVPILVTLYLLTLCLIPPWRQWMRYLAPMTPLLALSLLLCISKLRKCAQNTRHDSRGRLAVSFLGGLVVFVLALQSLSLFQLYAGYHGNVTYADRNGQRVAYRLFYYDAAYEALDAGLDWLRQRARPDDIVAATMPHWVYLRTGLKAVMPPMEADLEKAHDLLDSVPVRYVLIDGSEVKIAYQYARPVVQHAADRWKVVYFSQRGSFEIYERVDGPQAAVVPPVTVPRLTDGNTRPTP